MLSMKKTDDKKEKRDPSKSLEAFINTSVGSIFNLDIDAKDLPQEIAHIRQAFNGELKNEKDEYQFIQHPTRYLFRLEHTVGPVKVGEVKSSLLSYAHQRINTAAERVGLTLTPALWDKDQLDNNIKTSKDYTLPFKSEKPRTQNEKHLYPVPREEGQIYDAWVEVDVKNNCADVQMDLTLTSDFAIPSRISHFEPIPVFKHEHDLHYFLLDTAKKAESTVMSHVFDISRWFLHHDRYITLSEYMLSNPHGRKLLTFQLYVDMLINQKVSYAEIAALNNTQANTLTHPVVMQMIREEHTDIRRAKNLSVEYVATLSNPVFYSWVINNFIELELLSGLSKEQKMVASHHYYSKLIPEKKIDINEVKKLSPSECKNFFHPASIHLHMANKVSFQKIKKMTDGPKKIFSDPNYYDALMKDKIKYEDIELFSLKEAEKLTNPAVSYLVFNNMITLEEGASLTALGAELLKNDSLVRHLKNRGYLSIEDINCIQTDSGSALPYKTNDITALDKQCEPSFRVYLSEFVQLAKAGLLFEQDLWFLYENVKLMSSNLFKYKIEAKRNVLLTSDIFVRRCHTNIRQRLHNAMAGALDDKKQCNDTIERISKDCKAFGFDVEQMRVHELHEQIKYQLNLNTKQSASAVVKTGTALGFSPQETLGYAFTHRLSAVFDQIPYKLETKTDTVAIINADIDNFSNLFKLPVQRLRANIVSSLAMKIKDDIEKAFDMNSNETPLLFKQIHDVFVDSKQKSEAVSDDKQIQDIWHSAFKHVIQTAEEKSMELTSGASEKKSNNAPRISSTLFLPKRSLSSPNGMLDFCNKLTNMAQFFVKQNVVAFAFKSKQ